MVKQQPGNRLHRLTTPGDRLYFSPLTLEDVLNVIEAERPEAVIVFQFGGQTPLKLALAPACAGWPRPGRGWPPAPGCGGTFHLESIDPSEDAASSYGRILRRLEIASPANGLARTADEARAGRRRGYPVVVRPSYVLAPRHGSASSE